jgi:IS4 transposase
LRRIEVRLFEKTRDGEKTMGLLTNLPETVSAVAIAEIYRKRWTIETQFQFLTVSLHCEVPGPGKPKAALFAFAMSLVASNALAVVRASLRAAHGKWSCFRNDFQVSPAGSADRPAIARGLAREPGSWSTRPSVWPG